VLPGLELARTTRRREAMNTCRSTALRSPDSRANDETSIGQVGTRSRTVKSALCSASWESTEDTADPLPKTP